jgi:hypothetical protein
VAVEDIVIFVPAAAAIVVRRRLILGRPGAAALATIAVAAAPARTGVVLLTGLHLGGVGELRRGEDKEERRRMLCDEDA